MAKRSKEVLPEPQTDVDISAVSAEVQQIQSKMVLVLSNEDVYNATDFVNRIKEVETKIDTLFEESLENSKKALDSLKSLIAKLKAPLEESKKSVRKDIEEYLTEVPENERPDGTARLQNSGRWTSNVLDENKLFEFCYHNPTFRKMWKKDEAAINAFAKALGKQFAVDGCSPAKEQKVLVIPGE